MKSLLLLTTAVLSMKTHRSMAFLATSAKLSVRAFGGSRLSALAQSPEQISMPGPRDSEPDSKWVESGHVYFVATPLGNLHDISPRAIEILTHVDVICAEDTRNTIHLLRSLSIPHKKVISHHEHNERHSVQGVLQLVHSGKSVAVVSDAGTPGISDPGALLAAALAEEDLPLHPVPGPSAVISALSICGFPASEFTFLGFLPVKGRRTKLAAMANIPHTVVFFEAPHRILRTFNDLAESQPDRLCVCCRELTKKFEEIRRGTVRSLQQWLQEQEDASLGIRGEFTVVLGPFKASRSQMHGLPDTVEGSNNMDEDGDDGVQEEGAGSKDIGEKVVRALEICRAKGLKRSAAVRNVASELNVSRTLVYGLALDISW